MGLTSDDKAKFKFIGCEIIYREACKLASQCSHRVDVEFMPKGLHDLETADMQARLQAAIDDASAEAGYKAILLGYARCNDGVVGLTARDVPLVIPKAHDCITFFFGCRHAYKAYFDAHPGTYYHTTGWLERDNPEVEGSQGVMQQLGLSAKFEEMVEQYGEDNAKYIMETLGGGLEHYDRICYLKMNTTDETPFIDRSKREAEDKGWQFELREGDWSILERLFAGKWTSDDFLILQPGQKLIPRNDDEVLGIET